MVTKKKTSKKTRIKNTVKNVTPVKLGRSSEKYPKGGFAKVYSDIIWRGD
jgi:hypothetical protein